MASLRERRRKTKTTFQAVFYDPTRRPAQKYVILRTRDRRDAQRKLHELEKREAQGLYDPWTDAVPRAGVLVSEAIEQYLKSRQHLRPKSRLADQSTLNLFVACLPAGCLLSQIEPRHIDGFLTKPAKAKTLSAATANTYHTRVSGFLSWCVDSGIIRDNPARKVVRPKLARREKSFLSREQYKRLLRTIDAHATMIETGAFKQASLRDGHVRWLIEVVEVAVATGLRRTELVHMRWSWINFDEQHIVVRRADGFVPKSKHERTIPVRGHALEILERLNGERASEDDEYVFMGVGGAQLDATYVSKRFKLFVGLARLPKELTFHCLRHTFCSWMIQAGVPVAHVQRLAGHASLETTMQYIHLAPDSLSAAVEKVFG